VVNLMDEPGITDGDGEADCTIRMSAADFIRLAEGKADSRMLFFSGKLKVDGDMGLALKLKKLLQSIFKMQ
jgi:predicted lipid carrier protein YhbT